MQVIEENSTNWLVLTDDGSTTTKTKSSDLNKLLYGHNLFGLIDEGSEVWMGSDEDRIVTIIPGDDAKQFTLRLSDAPDLHLGEHQKTELVGALADVYEDHDGDNMKPLVDLYDRIRADMIRSEVIEPFASAFGEKVENREDGWFINGHLLLTMEGEFYHPSTDSRQRSGSSVIPEGSGVQSYGLRVDNPRDSMERNITLGNTDYRLTDKEMKFLGRAIWAVENTPDRR